MKNRTARDIMATPARSVRPDATLDEVARLMLDHDIGSVLVVDEHGRLAGIVTDSDFAARPARLPFSTFSAPKVMGEWLADRELSRIYEEARKRSVTEIMTTRVHSVTEDTRLAEILKLMLEHDVKHVPVLREGEAVGVVSRHDLLRLVHREIAGDGGTPVGEDGETRDRDG